MRVCMLLLLLLLLFLFFQTNYESKFYYEYEPTVSTQGEIMVPFPFLQIPQCILTEQLTLSMKVVTFE